MGDDILAEEEVVALLGPERFRRLRRDGWLTSYARHYVLFRLREDKALHPEARRPAVVAKGYPAARRGGVPEVITDRNSVRSVVVKVAPPAAASVLTPRVRAALEELLEKAERFLAREGIAW
jgi:hypothetical protein